MKVKVSAVSYLNTLPFLYGIENSELAQEMDLSLDIPSECARKLLNNEVDLGLVPVAIIPQLKEHHIVTDFCIAANKKVNSVFLLSDVPLNEIDSIYLDYQSRTSVNLVRVLAENHWKKSFEWKEANEGFEQEIGGEIAGVVIGDRAFELRGKFKYVYDLAEEWFQFSGKPFTFACWISNKEIPADFVIKLNEALNLGVNNIEASISNYSTEVLPKIELEQYLKNDIDYKFSEDKKESLQYFLSFLK